MVLLEMNANYVSFVGSCVWVGQHAAKRLRLQHLASVQAIPVLSKCVSTDFERTFTICLAFYVNVRAGMPGYGVLLERR